MLELLKNAGDLALVIFGFGMVIVVHELGHFLAARWAGIRVHEFAIGFGPAICSYRRGLGWRRGSSSSEHERLLKVEREGINRADLTRLSPTEYRLNYVPLGGYVKMLGQEDLNPGATSNAPDSYAAKPVWKRLVVISAGVVMNLLLAAAIFIVVYMVGLPSQPPIVGDVAPGLPAARAVVLNGERLGVTERGLKPGDRIIRIGNATIDTFSDIAAEAAMAGRGEALRITVKRPGVAAPVEFGVTPTRSERTRLLELGVGPAISTTVFEAPREAPQRRFLQRAMERAGISAVNPGMTLVSVNGAPVEFYHDYDRLMRESGGAPASLRFEDRAGDSVTVELAPRALLEAGQSPVAVGSKIGTWQVSHLLGLAPPLSVALPDPRAEKAGLRDGDVLAQVGGLEWPNAAQAISEIRRRAGREISLIVVRDGRYEPVTARVDSAGRIGFNATEATDSLCVVTRPPAPMPDNVRSADSPGGEQSASESTVAISKPAATIAAAERLGLPPGTAILRVAGGPVTNYTELRSALVRATQSALGARSGAEVPMTVRLPIGEGFGAGPTQEVVWSLTVGDVAALHALGYGATIPEWLFRPAEFLDRATGPIHAIAKGAARTKRVIVMTYLTLLRLFEGTVRVEHLKGPVGIAHLGAQLADSGLITLLFFLAIISANLAVLNFLPLPIVDGGHAVFLIIEWITGKPVSVAVQNVATIIGLLLLGGLFLVVTFNDIAGIVTG